MSAPDSPQPLFRTENLSLHFDGGRTCALHGVDLTIEAGESIAIVGASGSGKSSLLNLLGALEKPTHGQCYFRNRPYASLGNLADFRRQHIGFVFQSFHLLPTLNVLENVLAPTLGSAASRSAHHTRALSLLTRLGLAQRLTHFPRTLSGGERQRVAIARALINQPDVILADEPTGALDSASAAEVMNLLTELHREHGTTLITVTHDESVSAAAERILRMRDGRLLAPVGEAS